LTSFDQDIDLILRGSWS